MQILGHITASGGAQPAFSTGLNMARVITRVETVAEARTLPRGSVVGDVHGGLTFTDAVAAVLETRSTHGWREIQTLPGGEVWTVIQVNR
jgi:hypothetical protein